MESSETGRGEPAREDLDNLRERLMPPGQRVLGGPIAVFVSVACIGLALFTLYMTFTVTLGPVVTRATHLIVAIPLTFLLYPALRESVAERPSALDYGLALVAASAFFWAIYSFDRWELRTMYVSPIETLDVLFAVAATVVIIEAVRRTVGVTLVILSLLFVSYAITGPLWPGVFEHQGASLLELVETIFMRDEGMFNFIMGIMATYLFAFMMISAFLQTSRGDKFFNDLAMAVAGHRQGGPAKVAVFSSGMFGMLSGAVMSNVVTTGTMTIPMMKRIGFKPHEAAAIESTASLGGALTPPLMGAGVFLMAQLTGTPLITIIGYSVLPAVLYFTSIYFYVDIKARKRNMASLRREDLPRIWPVVKSGGHIILPIAVLVGLLLLGFTPFFAGGACVVVIFFASWLRSHTRMTPQKLLLALEASTRIMITLSSLGACAGLIYGVLIITGLLVKITSIILTLSAGSLFLGIVLVGLMSYVLGMGLPITASYILIAVLGAPALSDLGVPIFTAHMIIFWFAQDAAITPPVCMTAFVAARIAKARPMRTGWESVRMAKALYLMPFVFAYGSLLSDSLFEVLFDFAVLFGTFAIMPIAIEGYLSRGLRISERVVFTLAGTLFFIASIGTVQHGLPWLAGAGAALLGGRLLVRWWGPAAAKKTG